MNRFVKKLGNLTESMTWKTWLYQR